MRKKYVLHLIALFLLIPALAFQVLAAEGYVASKNSDVFHDPDCSYVDSIEDYNLIYFDSLDDALSSGRRGCSRCDPEIGSYTRNSDSSSSDTDTFSYIYGFYSGKDYGYDQGYDEGMEIGESAGYDRGYSTGYQDAKEQAERDYEAQLEEEISATSKKNFWIAVFSFIPLHIFISGLRLAKQQKEFDAERTALQKQIRQTKADYEQQILQLKNEAVFRKASAYDESLPDLPDGVRLVTSCIPIKGADSKDKPFGDYTIYITRGGKKYHCKRSCSGADIPVHYFDRPAKLEPCSICVPKDMYPQPTPEWYTKICNPDLRGNSTSSTTDHHSTDRSEQSSPDAVGPNPASGITEIHYIDGSLYVTFGNGKCFRFDSVPDNIWNGLQNAPSRENYFRTHIDGYFTYLLIYEKT